MDSAGPPAAPAESRRPDPGQPEPNSPRRRWVRPKLTVYGDLRRLTMGPSPGTGESGNVFTYKSPKAPPPHP